MGRCQGGFCTPHVVRILAGSWESLLEITKRGKGSELLTADAKLYLKGEKPMRNTHYTDVAIIGGAAGWRQLSLPARQEQNM